MVTFGRVLPPYWDGAAVQWSEWARTDTTTLEHGGRRHGGSRPPCTSCGTTAAPVMSGGIVDGVFRLFAFRCPDCAADTVWDMSTDEWWLLDESDYGPDGSTDPRLF